MVCGISYDFERIIGIASVQTIDPVVETKSEGAASTLESKSSTTRLVASEAIALPTTSVLRLNSTPLPAHRRCINLRKDRTPAMNSATSSYRRFVQKGNVKAYFVIGAAEAVLSNSLPRFRSSCEPPSYREPTVSRGNEYGRSRWTGAKFQKENFERPNLITQD